MDIKGKILEKGTLHNGAGSIIVETENGNRMEINLSREEMQEVGDAGSKITINLKAVKDELEEAEPTKIELMRPAAETEMLMSSDEKQQKSNKPNDADKSVPINKPVNQPVEV